MVTLPVPPPPPREQLSSLLTPYFIMFWKDSLMALDVDMQLTYHLDQITVREVLNHKSLRF